MKISSATWNRQKCISLFLTIFNLTEIGVKMTRGEEGKEDATYYLLIRMGIEEKDKIKPALLTRKQIVSLY